MIKDKFKIGQEVICIGNTYSSLNVGGIYTIEFVDEDDSLQFKDIGWWYNPDDFVILTPASALLYRNLTTGK